jgi:hypothetical protein
MRLRHLSTSLVITTILATSSHAFFSSPISWGECESYSGAKNIQFKVKNTPDPPEVDSELEFFVNMISTSEQEL